MRTAVIERKTGETEIRVSLDLDAPGAVKISTGVGFFDHVLTLFGAHGGFGLEVSCKGDVQVDGHHTVEDVGICLGRAFGEALGDKGGVARYGDKLLPMDEALILTAVDLSGRGMLCWEADIPAAKVGDFDTELAEEFFTAFAREAGITLHVRQLAGKNSHHILEGIFKSAARSLRQAVTVEVPGGAVPSTKGVL